MVDDEGGFLKGGQPDKLLAGDFNGDGYGEVVKQVSLSDKIVLFLNDGNGGLAIKDLPDPREKLADGAGLADTEVADFNGDGNDDVITLWDTNQAAIFVKLGSASPSLRIIDLEVSNSESNYSYVAAGSIEQNGVVDFVVASDRKDDGGGQSVAAEVAVYENNGTGRTFSKYFHTKTTVDVQDLMLEDLSFDGYADLMVGPVFWRHSYNGGAYRDCGANPCRVSLQWDRAEAATQFIRAEVTDDDAPELVAIHDDFKFTVLRPYCPE
ncbi:MAG: FG-GAP repeat domain-containing protein [Bradymonadaceae bacterium]